MKSFKIALCQIKVTDDKEKNLTRALACMDKAQENKAQMVVLPEMFICPYDSKLFRQYAECIPDGPSAQRLSIAARSRGIYLFAGSIPELDEKQRLYNTCAVFGPDGSLLGKHRKMHLFDIDVPGQIFFKESESLTAGDAITLIDTGYMKVGVAICYDLRFPELSRLMALSGAEMLVIPAAFNMVTGPAHWEISLRTRALDNQVYVCACAPARDEAASYVSYANSIAVDPWGSVLARAGTEEEIIYADIDGEKVRETRMRLPLLKHVRSDLYEIVKKP